MNSEELRIAGYSTALFSTWFFVESYGLLFDAGDGLSSALLQKSRKIKHVFISHADRDHLGGLFQFHQLNGRGDFPRIHFPAHSGSFPAIADFTQRFDPHVRESVWIPIHAGQEFDLHKGLAVHSVRNEHIDLPAPITKSLSYLLVSKKEKLKPEFRHLSGQEIRKLADTHGRAHLSQTVSSKLLGYSGDTPVSHFEHWDNTEILIHEATFLGPVDNLNNRSNKHSYLEEVLQMVSELRIGKLILSHFSSRYSAEEIDATIKKLAKAYQLQLPIYRILPGETNFDILRGEPVYEG
ncbi:MBL fold metallo-hydrolase [Flavilitoribacter nigricans]|uniref:RNAse Z n=1 Tax=Flavilitoribacter nigricans (strain ATCC 23147 / DSM 23189 / NBRC 102662 / NCIMB 1420 / SS-2) TaxID=1122177 RepID=A0A2D0MYT2_FLAN2|nr:MBL fold metallo-hydrolase [Flavilitoribacter nigricans]PHN00613.1 RNAse Z [Flavilitoribacter nigricans DSM 23189 = NBRC 102662]